jgi:hypothetical protein
VEPTRVQYFYAGKWPTRLWRCAFQAISIVGWWHSTGLPWFSTGDATTLLLAIGSLVLFVALGHFVAVLVGWFVLGPVYFDRMLKNGGPFQPGDTVLVLSKPHRGCVARVYQVWQGDAVRVELGDQAKGQLADIFQPIELLRVQPDPSRASAA